MNDAGISTFITETFPGVEVATDSGNSFFSYNPNGSAPPKQWVSFATLVTNDCYDQFSNLNRSSVFRLNIGVGKQTYHSLFGDPERPSGGDSSATGDENLSDDYTALDRVMPHPIYGRMYWVCVLILCQLRLETGSFIQFVLSLAE